MARARLFLLLLGFVRVSVDMGAQRISKKCDGLDRGSPFFPNPP